ncbi:hypothetical protein G4D82_09095 [Flavobacterium sp. CYK-4]|uniref:hypothetical protein n=1 Tax=Flavobacterium lotistagni TaxID=2709660 RepID=UPI00140C7337|nr:hypothetical protein [Flavobacterium lotistagni]NHM07375.1 hypothetical protein [Flavobacterium lotistagni]
MKTIKTLLLLVVFSAVTFYSCSDEKSIVSSDAAVESTAMRTVLNKLKLENTVGPNRSAQVNADSANPMLCFEFVFPITFAYNNGTLITASSLEGLLEILNNESPALHLTAVVFPFQVQYGGAVQTINDEADLIALIIQCGLPTFDDDLQHTYCFDIVFPITAVANGQSVTINSQEELNAYLNNPATTEANIVFPITIVNQNQTIVLNSIYDFYNAVNDCNDNNCICTQEYVPVCVQTPTGIVEFANTCYAMCAGFTQNDFISCNGSGDCSITNVVATPGACSANGTYELTIDFDSVNPTAPNFQVFTSGNELLGTYSIASLPVTIPNFPYSLTTIPNDNCQIRIGANCSAIANWIKPNCNGICTCPTDYNPVCVQTPVGIRQFDNACWAQCEGFTQNDFVTCPAPNFGELLGNCFNIVYPVNVQYQGALVTVNNNGELLQYWNPVNQPIMPAMSYPITATFGNSVYTFANQAAFQSQIELSCP